MPHVLRTSLLVLLAAGALGWLLPPPILGVIFQRVQTVYRQIAAVAARRPAIVVLFIWIVALVPMIHHTMLVRHYSVNVPIFDDWAMAPLIVKAHAGQLRFADIFQQQQEARTVLPNLIFILTAQSEWNVRDQMVLSLVASWLTAAGVFVLLRRSGLNQMALAICFWLVVLALFSPAPFELWLFASGFPSFLPLLFLVAALVAIRARISTFWKFVICAALAVASTFTLAHGLLAWALTFPLLLISHRPPRWKLWLAAWATAAAICATIYFWGYEKPVHLPGFAPAVSLLEYVSFVLQFLGGSLAYALNHQPATAAIGFGLAKVALLVISFCYLARRLSGRDFVAAVVPWSALALHAVASAFLAALGRVGFGSSYALASRYVPFSLGLTIAVIVLTALVLRDLGRSRASRLWGLSAAAILIAGYLIPYKFASGNTLFYLRGYAANNRLAKSAVLFSQAIDTSSVIKAKVFPPAPDYVVRNAAALDDLKLLRPPLVRSNRLNASEHEIADRIRVAGLCESIVTGTETSRASGWALLKAKGRPADCVLISYELPGSEPTLFAISDSIEMRWDIARRSWPNDNLWAGWTATFPQTAVPPNAKLAFWAVDADEPRLYRLAEKGP
jgi:hypothetical protein